MYEMAAHRPAFKAFVRIPMFFLSRYDFFFFFFHENGVYVLLLAQTVCSHAVHDIFLDIM